MSYITPDKYELLRPLFCCRRIISCGKVLLITSSLCQSCGASVYKNKKGFTLVELIVVIVVTGFVASLGFRTFTEYTQKQIVEQAALNFKTALEEAKFNSVSRVKPSVCGSDDLTGYEFSTKQDGTTYVVSAICGGTQNVSTRALADGVTYSRNNCEAVFSVLSNYVIWGSNCQTPGLCADGEFCITISRNGSFTKNIFLDHGGTVRLQ